MCQSGLAGPQRRANLWTGVVGAQCTISESGGNNLKDDKPKKKTQWSLSSFPFSRFVSNPPQASFLQEQLLPPASYPPFVRHVLPRKLLLQCCVESECAGYHIKSLIRDDINMFYVIIGVSGLRFHIVTLARCLPQKSLIAAAFPPPCYPSHRVTPPLPPPPPCQLAPPPPPREWP